MRKVNPDVSSFLAGSILGLGAGYILARLLHRRAIEQGISRQLAAEDAHRRSRADSADVAHDALIRDVRSIQGETDGSSQDDFCYAGGDPDGESEEGTGADNDGAVAPADGPWPPVDRDTSKPYLISADEFAEVPEYNKISVTWYQGDAIPVLVDDHEKPVPNYQQLVGSIGYRSFGGPSEDDEIAYVRNEAMQTDFEIARRYESYAEGVLGYGRPG